MGEPAWDVFVSYGHADAEWVGSLAANLHRVGFSVFFDVWELVGGDSVTGRLEGGLRSSTHGILVVSAFSLSRPWVKQEFEVLLRQAVENPSRRLIPVLFRDAELPPFLANREWVDFRTATTGPPYDTALDKLVRSLQGRPAQDRPDRGGPTQWPQAPYGQGFRPAGPVQATLRISRSDVALTTDGAAEVSQRPRGLHAPTIEAVRNLRREWRRTQGLREAGPDRSDHALAEAGRRLSQDFLAGEVGKALAEAVAAAAGGNEVVELGLDIDPELADLPWEALQLPGSDGEIPEVAASPLALHRSVALFRRASNLGPTPAYKIRGPLRILVAIASPEKQNEAGELLDYEAELARIVAAVDPARRKGQASAAVLLAVDADPSDTWPSLRSFARDVGTAGHDFGKDDGKVDAAFGINELDTTVMLNASGKVVSRTIGALDDAGLRAALAKAGVGR